MNTAGADCANSGLGILFSTQSFTECPFTSFNTILPPNRANVFSSTIISDTSNWTTISGYFIADSAYQYFQIGNLFSDSIIDTDVYVYSTHLWQHIGYYLLDDVIVEDSLMTHTLNYSSHDNLDVFPNPFSKNTTVKIELNKNNINGVLQIIDVRGNIQKQINIQSDEIVVERENFPDGIYLLKVITDNETYSKKIIIN
jgi:hypothetical protein